MAQATERTLAGFERKTVTTKAGGHPYEVEILQATGKDLEPETRELSAELLAWFLAYEEQGKDPNETIAKILNSSQEQSAKQNRKSEVVSAVNGEKDAGTVEDAVKRVQASARDFLQGAPRGGGGKRHESGLTTKQRAQVGDFVATHMAKHGSFPTEDDYQEFAESIGVNLEDILKMGS